MRGGMKGNSRGNAGLVETLEARQLLSGAILSHGVLKVFGDGGSLNTITVNNSADGLSVDVAISSTNRLGVVKPFAKSFPKSLIITSVFVRGGHLADTINVGQSNGSFVLPTRVLSLAGDDHVTTGAGNDIVFAGAGNDTVSTGNGTDWVRGDSGNDVIDAGAGDDRVRGGVGNDIITGGVGADLVRGDAGDDNLSGGSGDDLIFGDVGNDSINGESGNDSLWGGVGNDTILGGTGSDTLGGFIGTNTLNGEGGQDTFVVRTLALNPTNDFDATIDILMATTRLNEGGRPPAA
jgi:Ca2+-binding RTX toxin-like protein